MFSRKANDAWEEAETADERTFRPRKANGGRRKAPFYKIMQGMPIAVDAFCYGVVLGLTSYFLTYSLISLNSGMLMSRETDPAFFFQACTFRPLYEPFVDLAGGSDSLLQQVPRGLCARQC